MATRLGDMSTRFAPRRTIPPARESVNLLTILVDIVWCFRPQICGENGTGNGKVNVAEKESGERRVYVLPAEQLERIRAYQTANGISAEVEAVRRLLDLALQMRDSVQDLLKKLKSRFADEKDIRVLARDILAAHALIRSVQFEDDAVTFAFANGDRGRLERSGRTLFHDGDREEDDWNEYPPPPRRPPAAARVPVGGAPSWDAPRGGDLDDEIPF
jgi:hypothetical protein